MNTEVKYSGFTAVPSDYDCQDGQLAVAINTICEDGALHPVGQPKVTLQLPDGCTVIYIHKTSSFEHYIIQDTSYNKLYWVDASEEYVSLTTDNCIGTYPYIAHLNAVGNTLLVFTKSAINYLLWKSGAYNALGDHLPEISISFGLVGHPRLYSAVKEDDSSSKRGTFSITFNSISKDALHNTFSDENKQKITSQVMAKVNKFIAEQTINKGRFCFPFFVRWAYRLYDGSHVMQSAPVLMTPSTTPAPIVLWKRATGKGSYTDAELDIMMVAADLDYRILTDGDYAELDKWQDIITAIDIFVSKPIYTYDQSGEFSSFNDDDNFQSKFIGRLCDNTDSSKVQIVGTVAEDCLLLPFTSTAFISEYMEYSYGHIYSMYFATDRLVPNSTLHMPEFSDDKRDESIRSNAIFYKLADIDIKDVKTDKRQTIPIEDDYLQSLTTRETLTDDYLSHDRLVASYSYGFNSRLNLSGIKRDLFNGFISHAMFPYCSNQYSLSTDTSTKTLTVKTDTNSGSQMRMRVYVRENGEVYYVESQPGLSVPNLRPYIDTGDWKITSGLSDGRTKVTVYDYSAGTKTVTIYDSSGNTISTETTQNSYRPTAWGTWLYYPNANAFKLAVYENSELMYVTDLKAHDFLNGAYAFLGFTSGRGGTPSALPDEQKTMHYDDETGGTYVEVPNKIYTSEVNNPFYFPVTGINTVGTGEIRGICSAAKALSQGQFGQFPLYAFTTEGVWALEVSTTGTYSAKQPFTRDVCINTEGITQLDSSVLFPSDRGIMLISGSQAMCISDTIKTDNPFQATSDNLPAFDTLHDMLGHEPSTDKCLPTLAFTTFLKQCRMIYDYVNQHVIVYAPGITYAYVYSLKSQQWGMTFSNIASHLNSYPEALAVNTSNQVVNYSTPLTDDVKALYLTRPLKLGDPNALKTVDNIIQRGFFRKGHVASVLYGSRDLFHWHLVWSSQDHYLRGYRGTPYKYFRIAGVATLATDESIDGASVQFTPRQGNQPR